MLRDYAKSNQLASGHFISEDLLIRSNKEIQKNIMPFLKLILPNSTSDPVFELTTYKRYGGFQQSNFVAEDEAKDNFFREQQIEEEYKRYKPKSSTGKATQMQFQATSHYKKEDLTAPRKQINMDEINDSDLDMLLDDLKEVLDEEDISD